MHTQDGRYPQHTVKGLEENGESFVVLASEPIARHQQVCLTYGNLANFLLLPQFGFVLPELPSPPDLALVDCSPLVSHVAASAAGVSKLEQLAEDGLLMRDGDGSPSGWQTPGPRLEAALHALAKDGMLPASSGTGQSDDDSAAGTSSVPMHAWVTYKQLFQGTLGAYTTTIAQDRAALGLDGASGGGGGGAELGGGEDNGEPLQALAPRARLALQFRLAQKALLNQALAQTVGEGATVNGAQPSDPVAWLRSANDSAAEAEWSCMAPHKTLCHPLPAPRYSCRPSHCAFLALPPRQPSPQHLSITCRASLSRRLAWRSRCSAGEYTTPPSLSQGL